MRKLPLPQLDSGEVYRTCTTRIRDTGLKYRLNAIEQHVIDAATSYIAAGHAAQLHKLDSHTHVGGLVTKDEMSDVYTLRMAKEKSPGRPIYDQLMRAAKHATCPLCGLRKVSTLDHHLPKAFFPVFAVVPANLVPACRDCNCTKINSVPQNESDQTIHPYFDDFESETWLFAEVIRSTPPAIRYYVDPPAGWSRVAARRVANHFDMLQLATLYTSHAADELESMRYVLTELLTAAGCQGVKDHLISQATSNARVHLNSWKTAMYKALSEDDWYCQGGFC